MAEVRATIEHGCVKNTTLIFKSLLFAVSVMLISLNTGCSSIPSSPEDFDEQSKDGISYWHGDDMTGSPSIVISLSEQRAYFYKGDHLAGMSLISSGREGLDTVTGNFKIIQKDEYHRSSLFGDYVDGNGRIIQKDVDTSKHPMPAGASFEGAKMPFFMRIVGGTGMHEGFLPGYPASHGCIRMPEHMAESFFRSTSLGTPVAIRY